MIGLFLVASSSLAMPVTLLNETELITPATYPPEAKRKAIAGRTRVKISINPQGKQYRCEIITSSGSTVLDNGTCTSVMRTARYEPAKDASGVPMVGQDFLSLNWRIANRQSTRPLTLLPDLAFTVEQLPGGVPYAYLTVRVLVDENGEGLNCEVVRPSVVPSVDAVACRTILAGAAFAAATDEAKRPVRSMQKLRVVFAPPAPALFDSTVFNAEGGNPAILISSVRQKNYYPDDARAARSEGISVVDLQINASGEVTNCALFTSSGSGSLDAATCKLAMSDLEFRPAKDAAGKSFEQQFQLTIEWRIDTACISRAPNGFCITSK